MTAQVGRDLCFVVQHQQYFQLKTHYFSNTLTSVVRPLIFINFDSVTTSHNEIYKEKFYH